MSGRFQDKFAVVSGGNSGIGLATALAFIREGASVAIIGRDEMTLEAAQQELGPGSLAIKADMSRLTDIAGAMEQIDKAFGRIDALFVNAGIGRYVPIEDVTEKFFDETMATNLKGAYFTIQKALPLFSRDATVVLNASVSAHMGRPGSSVYGASKAAVISMAKTLSADLIGRGVRVNAVSPGPVATPIFDRMGLPEEQARQMKEQTTQRIPLGRFGRPEEVAAAVLFLCSGESAFIVGSELVIDGGMMQR